MSLTDAALGVTRFDVASRYSNFLDELVDPRDSKSAASLLFSPMFVFVVEAQLTGMDL